MFVYLFEYYFLNVPAYYILSSFTMSTFDTTISSNMKESNSDQKIGYVQNVWALYKLNKKFVSTYFKGTTTLLDQGQQRITDIWNKRWKGFRDNLQAIKVRRSCGQLYLMSVFHIDILYTIFMYLACLLVFIYCVLMVIWVFVLKCAGEQVFGERTRFDTDSA